VISLISRCFKLFPPPRLKQRGETLPGNGHDDEYQVTLRNAGAGLALLVHLRLVKVPTKQTFCPFFGRTITFRFAGERREVRVSVRKSISAPLIRN